MRIRNSIFNLLLCIVLFSNISRNQQKANVTTDLEALFHNPPSSAKPYAWRHWMGSNFSVILITKDLEAMKESGIGETGKIDNRVRS